jgi:hypothetical protein
MVKTLTKCLQLERVPSNKCGFKHVNQVSNTGIISTVGSLSHTNCTVISMHLDEEPITPMIYLNDFGFYGFDF